MEQRIEEFAKHLRTVPRHGKSQDVVECACGNVQYVYRWSWAGHGFFRCKLCKGKVSYRTLKVTR